MASTTALWFHIETAFAEIEELCTQARAAELAARHAQDEANLLRSFSRGRGGYEAEEETVVPSGDRFSRATELAKDLAFREAHANGADLVELRALLRKRLTWLKARFAEVLADHEVYYTLFPIVVYCDELVNTVTRGASARWEPLQSELYEIDNGGEVFYSILDDRLRQEETSPIVLEVFYFCLKDGFMGMYQGDKRKIDEYKARLVERTRLKPVSDGRDAGRRDVEPIELVSFPWRYYALAAGGVVAAYLMFSVFAWMSS